MSMEEYLDLVQLLDRFPVNEHWTTDDWVEVFIMLERAENIGVPDITDVIRFWATSNGVGSDLEMVAIVKLIDGRFAVVAAGNTFQGWGGEGESVQWSFHVSLGDAIYNGLSNADRERFGLSEMP